MAEQAPQSAADKAAAKAQRRKEQLGRVLNEITSSERTYIKDLEITLQMYFTPLSTDASLKGMLTGKQINGIFSNMQQIIGVNQALLKQLEDAGKSIESVVAAFTSMSEYLKVYSIYCSNQDQALSMVEELTKKNRDFRDFMEENQAKFLSRGLDLKSFLIKPTQRICKYPLFLRELIACCDDKELSAQLKEIDGRINAIVSHVNEQKRTQNGLEAVIELHNKLVTGYPGLVTNQRILMHGSDSHLELISKTNSLALLMQPMGAPQSHNSAPRPSSAPEESGGGFLSGLKKKLTTSRESSPKVRRRSSVSSKRISTSSVIVALTGHTGGGDEVAKVSLFLFNDLIMCCKPCKQLGKKGMLQIEMCYDLEKIRVEDMPNTTCFVIRVLVDEFPDAYTEWTLRCRDALDKNAWMKAFGTGVERPILVNTQNATLDESRSAEEQVHELAERVNMSSEFIVVLQGKLKAQTSAILWDSDVENLKQVLYTVPPWLYRALETQRELRFLKQKEALLEPLMPAEVTKNMGPRKRVAKKGRKKTRRRKKKAAGAAKRIAPPPRAPKVGEAPPPKPSVPKPDFGSESEESTDESVAAEVAELFRKTSRDLAIVLAKIDDVVNSYSDLKTELMGKIVAPF